MRIFFIGTLIVSTILASEPQWIKDPSVDGKYIGSIGCVKEQKSFKLQKKVALLRAKGALSQQIETSIEYRAHGESSFDGDEFVEEFSFEISDNSTTSFEIKKMDTYIYDDKSLCIWIIKK